MSSWLGRLFAPAARAGWVRVAPAPFLLAPAVRATASLRGAPGAPAVATAAAAAAVAARGFASSSVGARAASYASVVEYLYPSAARVGAKGVARGVVASPRGGGATTPWKKKGRRRVAEGETTTTQRLKSTRQRTLLVQGAVAVVVVGAAAYNYEELQQFSERCWNMYTQPGVDDQKNILPPSQAPGMKTLVLDLEETMVHFSWDRANGWRCIKRPGFDEFLDYLAVYGLYEVVVWTNSYSMSADPWIEKLDPIMLTAQNQIAVRFSHRLYRDHARLVTAPDGSRKWAKDLESVLNRDMRHVVLVDKDGAADWLPQPDNVIYVPPWEGDMNDTALLDLLPLLEALAMPDVPDVREVIKVHKENRQRSGLSMAESFRLAQRSRRQRTREYLRQQTGSIFGQGAGQQMNQQQVLGLSEAEVASGEVGLVPLGVQRLPPERATLTPEQLEKQMEESRQMQLDEFADVASPLPGGIKIPKLPSSTADLSKVFGTAPVLDEAEEAQRHLKREAAKRKQEQVEAQAAAAAAAAATASQGGGGSGWGIFGGRANK